MDKNNKYIPSVESLTPYQSAADYFKTRMGEDETIKLVFTIRSPAESYAIMIKRTLEDNAEYDITITMTPLRKPGTREVESWHIHGISKELRVGDMTEERHHTVTGWIYDVAGYFNSSLRTLNYRI